MKKTLKLCWGCIPFVLFLLLFASVIVIQTYTGDTLRILPCNILLCIGVASFGCLLWWGNTRLQSIYKKAGKTNFAVVCVKIISVSLFAVLILICMFITLLLTQRPEHIVTRNGIKLVGSVNSFLDEYVTYYQYKNWLFYGQELGYEYYGSGGHDPLAQTPKSSPVEWCFYDLDGNIIESSSYGNTHVETETSCTRNSILERTDQN